MFSYFSNASFLNYDGDIDLDLELSHMLLIIRSINIKYLGFLRNNYI